MYSADIVISLEMIKKEKLTPEREKEIEQEMAMINGWFCSDWIKNIVTDLHFNVDLFRQRIMFLESELDASTAIIKGAPWYKDIEILQQEKAELNKKLDTALEALKGIAASASDDDVPDLGDEDEAEKWFAIAIRRRKIAREALFVLEKKESENK